MVLLYQSTRQHHLLALWVTQDKVWTLETLFRFSVKFEGQKRAAHRGVWMHAATLRCGYPADSSDLATGAAGAATSTPSPFWRRSDRGLRLMPGPVTAGDPVSLTQTVRPTGAPARASPGVTEPRGQAAHSVGSGQL